MMISLVSIAALALAMQAQPVASEESATTATPSETSESTEAENTEEAKDKDRIVCKRTAVIGTRFKKKCATKRDWQTLAERSQDATKELQKVGGSSDPGGN